MNNGKTKIAIVSYSLGTGGAERFAGELSFMLESQNYEVHHIIVNDVVDFPFCGKLFNLGEHCENDFWLFKKIRKGLLLNEYLENEKIDIIVDNRTRNHILREFITNLIYKKRKVFYLIHSFYLNNYLPKSVFLARKLYQKSVKIICVSKAIEKEVIIRYGLKNTTAIYNPVRSILIDTKPEIQYSENYILFYGRIEDNVKNFRLLLDAFSESKIYEYGFKLVIMGDGDSKGFVQDLVYKLNLTNYIKLIPFQKNPFAFVKKAKFTVLTSYYEGFPMSIVESLLLGTPVISVDCDSGPREIIVNEKNGLLVENHSVAKLSEAINRFVHDQELYRICKENAVESVAHLSPEKIAIQWKEILEKS
jgi:glycosyltransferase involved in cell wall biosynthesis